MKHAIQPFVILKADPFWLVAKKNNAESFEIIVTQDQAEEFAKHIKNMVLFQNDLK